MSAIVEMSTNAIPSFNASFTVTELLMKTLENCAKELASRCVNELASRHGFDANQEIKLLGLENLSLIRKQMAKKGVKASKEKVSKEKVLKEKKSSFPMPFVGNAVNTTGCMGLAYNRGLFTQCTKKRMDNGSYCKGCQSEADKNASGCPDCGTVESRLATGLYEFKDSKGRSPVSYLKVLEKLKLSVDAALTEAGKLNIEIPEEHFTALVSKKATGSRGRPKKTGAVTANGVEDLFAKLSSDADTDGEEEKPKKKSKLSDEEKEAKKKLLEEERAAKKKEREEKLAIEKKIREEKKAAEAAAEKKAREEKKAAEKAEKEAKKAAEKAEKEAKKAAKGKKETAVAPTVAPVPATKSTATANATETTEKKSVVRVQIDGVAYLKSKDNILYDPSTYQPLGEWNPETQKIDFFEEEDDEEEEEENYD